MAKRPMPVPSADTKKFWAGTREGRLRIQRCKNCGEFVFYPRLACPACWSTDLEWTDASGRGVIYSFTIVQRSLYDDLPAPYVVALVELDEGVRLMTNIVDVEPAAVRVGMPVAVAYRKVDDEITLPLFTAQKNED